MHDTSAGRKVTLTDTCDLLAVGPSEELRSSRRFALLVFCGPEAQVRLLEEGTAVVVGREVPCEVVVHDASVSRQHARFSMKGGEVWVEDLDSRNGTLLRGKRIERERLDGNDEVQIGTARLVLTATRPIADESTAKPGAQGDTIVENAQMKKLYGDAVRASRGKAPVLILGETGVGKEHVAVTIHREGDRRDGPFVTVNCAAIAPSLLESTFFGHERGAFTGAIGRAIGTFERASGGVLFLDEIGELSSTAQAALLRAIERQRIARVGSSTEIDVDVRIVAATHCDLEDMVEEGTFRQDLYFRLNAVTLDVPPLRERLDEIEPLVRHFVEMTGTEWEVRAKGITPEAVDALRKYTWPGNVRQLRYAIERAALLCSGDTIGVSDLPDYVLARDAVIAEPAAIVSALGDLALREQLSKYERALIEEAIRRASGNRGVAAKLLRVPIRTLFRRMRASGVAGVTDD
ncbi:MAG TPA: sigma 54-interacting transcriptional regulator [Polyangiaceae bacterium]|jgi:DNA-binding NtrC family response regulator|nr:sigma 54-interacting transcriptional regulator [Polyangiaceae bacterium]